MWSRHGAGGRLERRAGAAPASMGAARSAPRRRAAARARVGGRLGSGRSAGVLAVHLGEKGEERERNGKGERRAEGDDGYQGRRLGAKGRARAS